MRILKKLGIFLCLGFALFTICSCDEEPPVKKNEDTVFYRVDKTTDLVTNEMAEFALYEKELKIAENGNPYDYNYMKVYMDITYPSGKQMSVPAFWYTSTTINVNTLLPGSPSGISGVASTSKDEIQGTETVTPFGDPHYRVRFTPSEVGTYNYKLRIFKNDQLISTEHEDSFEVSQGETPYKGVLKVDETNKRTFMFSESLETFIAVGQNTAWYTSTTRKTEDYSVWFKNMHDNNMNAGRIWLATWGFCLHWGKSYNDYTNRVAQIARLDKMFELADENEIYFLFSLINHGQFSSTVNPEWDSNPYNEKNGGCCKNAYEFFTSDEAKKTYKNELMYLIARYGYSDKIISWELFNEVDWCDNYSLISQRYKQWHEEMGNFIKANDPFHHMVSTSYKGTDGNANGLECMDFTSPHDYSYTNKNMITNIIKTQTGLVDKYDKPVFFGEIGLNTQNGLQVYDADKTGITLHQGAWAGMMGGGVGGAMNWWWDSYVHPNKLYGQFAGAGAFAKLMNLKGSDYKLLSKEATVSSSVVGIMGYKFDNRAYGYVYDTSWTYYNTSQVAKDNIKVTLPINSGTYKVSFYDTNTGSILSTNNVESINNSLIINLPPVTTDIAFIIE